MDPDAAVASIKEALRDEDFVLADELASGVRQWVARGGYAPSDANWRELVYTKWS